MARYLIIISIVLIQLFCSKSFGQKGTLVNYKIEVTNWGLMFRGNSKWTISKDLISFERQNINRTTETYTKKLLETDNTKIINLLTKINLDTIKKDYVDNLAPDDMGEYDFKLTVDKTTKEFHVYQVKIDELFNLVKQINEFLPKEYQIEYNDAYFRFKNKTSYNIGFSAMLAEEYVLIVPFAYQL